MSQNTIAQLATETIAQNTNVENTETEKKTKYSLSSDMEDILNAIENKRTNKDVKRLREAIITLKALGVTTKDAEKALEDASAGSEPTDADYIVWGKALFERYTSHLVSKEERAKEKLAAKVNEKKSS